MRAEVVLVNGWGMTRAAWTPLADRLASRYVLHPVDLAELPPASPSAAVSALAQRAPRECHVVGWSLGAELALQWAHACPEQVKALALLAGTPCFVARDGWDCGMAPDVFESFAAQVSADAGAALARFAVLQARGEVDVSGIARMLKAAAAKEATLDALVHGLGWLRTIDMRSMLSQIAQPVLLVHGENDALVPAAAARQLAQALPRAERYTMPSTGHAPHVSRTAEVAARLKTFFDEH